ncbi:hypothetical protein BHE74_00036227 [Ensete ventricosum]|nr:hypothetical protein BHE74_00036227 [Ensete ventricosum]
MRVERTPSENLEREREAFRIPSRFSLLLPSSLRKSGYLCLALPSRLPHVAVYQWILWGGIRVPVGTVITAFAMAEVSAVSCTRMRTRLELHHANPRVEGETDRVLSRWLVCASYRQICARRP